MRFEPTHEQSSISEVVRSIFADWTPAEFEESEGALAKLDTTLTEGGWAAVGVPEEFGGSGFGLLEAMLVVEELGAALLPSAIRSTVSARRALALGANHSENEENKAQCKAMLQALDSDGSCAIGLVRPKGTTVLADAENCDLILLYKDGLGLAGGPDEFELKDASTLDTTRSHASIGDARSPTMATLDANCAARGLAEARALLAAELVGVARTALERSVAYASEREAFGKPIGSFQSIGHRLADTGRFVDGARVMAHAAAWHGDTGSAELQHFSRLALNSAQRAVIHATDAAMQVHGAYGITWEAGIHWYQRRAHVAAHLLGDATEVRREIAQELAEAGPVSRSADVRADTKFKGLSNAANT